jgi:hypothetical protein
MITFVYKLKCSFIPIKSIHYNNNTYFMELVMQTQSLQIPFVFCISIILTPKIS